MTDGAGARRAACLFAVFPGSFIFSMVYSEALMLALAAACLLALIRRQWLLAGVLAGLATAVRPNALALAAACAWASAWAIWHRREWRSLVAPILAPTGMLAYFGFLWWHTGEAAAWFRVEREGWHQGAKLGWSAFRPVVSFFRQPFGDPDAAVLALGLLFAIIGLALLVWRRWPGLLTVYVLAILVMGANSRLDSVRPRALLTAFPLIMAVGAEMKGPARRVVVALSATGFVLLAIGYNTGKLGQI